MSKTQEIPQVKYLAENKGLLDLSDRVRSFFNLEANKQTPDNDVIYHLTWFDSENLKTISFSNFLAQTFGKTSKAFQRRGYVNGECIYISRVELVKFIRGDSVQVTMPRTTGFLQPLLPVTTTSHDALPVRVERPAPVAERDASLWPDAMNKFCVNVFTVPCALKIHPHEVYGAWAYWLDKGKAFEDRETQTLKSIKKFLEIFNAKYHEHVWKEKAGKNGRTIYTNLVISLGMKNYPTLPIGASISGKTKETQKTNQEEPLQLD